MAKVNAKADWWAINGWFQIVTGVLGVILSAVAGGFLLWALVGGAINALVGYGLLKKSVVVFWIVFVLTGLGLLGELWRLSRLAQFTGGMGLNTLVLVVSFGLEIMLWQQIRKEAGKSKG